MKTPASRHPEKGGGLYSVRRPSVTTNPDNFKIEVTGAKELRRAIRRAENNDLKAALRKSNKDAATIVSDEAKNRVPTLTHALQKTIRANGSLTKGEVSVGRSKTNNYVRPIHFGWPSRGIAPRPFVYDALSHKAKKVRDEYKKNIAKVVRDLSN